MLAELPFQFADYARWHREWTASGAIDGQLDYWRRQLDGATGLDLPTDRPRPPVQSGNGRHASRSRCPSTSPTGSNP